MRDIWEYSYEDFPGDLDAKYEHICDVSYKLIWVVFIIISIQKAINTLLSSFS